MRTSENVRGLSSLATFEAYRRFILYTHGDNLPVGAVDKRVLAVHVVEVGEMSFFDLTDRRDQKYAARGRIVAGVGHYITYKLRTDGTEETITKKYV